VNLDSYKERIRVVSDLHLGHPSSIIASASELFPLLEDVDVLVLNGDTLQDLNPKWNRKSLHIFSAFEAKAKELGVRLVRTAGNHDPISAVAQVVKIDQGKVLITHGDAFYPEGSPWARDLEQNKPHLAPLLQRITYCGKDLQKRLEVARDMALALRSYGVVPDSRMEEFRRLFQEPKRILKILLGLYWMWEMGERFIAQYAPQTELLVFGHFHQNSVRLSQTSRQVCTGGFLYRLDASVVDVYQGEAHVKNLSFDLGRFQIIPHSKEVFLF